MLKTEWGDVRMPLEKVSSMDLDPPPASPAADKGLAWVTLKDGQVAIKLSALTRQQLTGVSPTFGELTISRSALSNLLCP